MTNIPEDVLARAVIAAAQYETQEYSIKAAARVVMAWADEQHGQAMMELAKEIERLREDLDAVEREKSEIEEWHQQSRFELENLRQAYAAFQKEHMA